jgi:class 3 adenylate cyclase/tetratricopeptide (TPR) repeat protein
MTASPEIAPEVGTARCSACGALTVPGSRFCGACGTEISRHCPACNALAGATQHFCTACGNPLDGRATKKVNEAVPDSGAERRLMTVVFCDLIGSSGLAARLDPEDFAALLVTYRERCVTAVAQYGGFISRYLGDGILACFGYPRAIGRDTQSAVACGLAIAREIAELARNARLPGSAELAVRIGIETGLVVAGRLGVGPAMESDALIGTAPNIAARLQQLAPANHVVIGEATYELVRVEFECEELPDHLCSHLQPPTRAFVVGEKARQGQPVMLVRRRSPMVGRKSEIAALRKRWIRVLAGEGQIVLISGEAGMGKSRLVQELLDRIGGEPHTLILLACAPSAAATMLYPAIEALRRSLDAAVESSYRQLTVQQALGNLVEEIGLSATPTLHLLAEVLGLGLSATDLTPTVRRRLLLQAMQAWLLRNTDKRPLLILAEDLHWSDPTLLDLLHSLADLLPGRRAMLLGTYRSHFILPWPDRSSTLRIALPPLGGLDAKRLIDKLARNLSPEARDGIIARSDGVPLFLEEFALAAGTLNTPVTLRHLFTAQLDGLGQAKYLAQCASLLRADSDADLLAAVTNQPVNKIEEQLAQLVDAEMLVRVTPPPAATFGFRHALLQQAVSESILVIDRRALHSRIAALLPGLRPAQAERQPEILAKHHEMAGELAAALRLYITATRRALGTAALEEAEVHVRHGLALMTSMSPDPEIALELHLLLGHVLIARRGYASAAVQEAFEAALKLAEQMQEAARGPPLRGLASFYQVRGPLSRAEAICNWLVSVAEQSGEHCALIDAWRRRGWNHGCMGRLAKGEEDLTRVLAAFDPARLDEYIATAGHDPRVLALANLCWLDQPRYGVVRAARRAALAAEAAHASPHPVSACYGFLFAALVFQQAGHWEEALHFAEHALAVATEKGIAYWVAMSHVAIGYDLVSRSDVARGRLAIRQGLASYRETQGELLRPFILTLLAEAELALGEVENASAALDEAAEVAKSLEAYGQIPWVRLRHAQLFPGPNYREKRHRLLAQALAEARAQGADAIARAATNEISSA